MIAENWKAPPDTPVDEDANPFPVDCIPGVAGQMAEEIGRVTTAQNLPLAAASVLGILSASIGAGIEIATGGERKTRGNLFILAIAESGTGKGEAFKLAAHPFEEAEAEAIEAFEMHTRPGLIAESNVAKIRADKLCKVAAKESDRHARALTLHDYQRAEQDRADIQRRLESAPRWKVEDATKEALAVIMQGQPGEAAASLSSEARGVLDIIKGRYGKEGGDEGFYCSAYSGDSFTVDRVGRPRVTLRRPCLSVLWMIQPDAARKAFDQDSFTESGLLPRFLIFDPKAEPQEQYEQPEPIPAEIKSGWERLVCSLADGYRNHDGEALLAVVSAAAAAALAEYDRENVRRRKSTGDLRDLPSYAARWTENAWKMALVLHCARHGNKAHHEELTAETAKDAIRVMRWFSDKQLETMSAGRLERLRKRLLALLAVLAAANGEISLRDLRRSHSFDDPEVRMLHANFPKSFRIEERNQTGGRPSVVAVLTVTLEDKK